jgi:hypothetical protein
MPRFNLFPYENRMLGLKETKIERELNMNTEEQALIAIANFKNGQEIPLCGDYTAIVVDFISDGAITYTPTPGDGSKVTVNHEELRDSTLALSVAETLEKVHPDYNHPLCDIIESDPAIFRLQSQEGYVINDALCLMSGNVTYPKREETEKLDALDNTNFATDEVNTLREDKEPVQGDLFNF